MRSRPSTSTSVAMIGLAVMGLMVGLVNAELAIKVPLGFEPNVFFNLTIPDTARFIRYRTGARNIHESNRTSSTWRTRFEVNQTAADVVYGGGYTEHQADAIPPKASMTFVFIGNRCWINGYAKGFQRGELSNTSAGMPPMKLQLNYAANMTTDITAQNFSEATGGVLADTGPTDWSAQSARHNMYPGQEGGLYAVTGITISTGLRTEASSFQDAPKYVDYAVINGTQNSRWRVDTGLWNVENPFDTSDSENVNFQAYASYQHLNGQGSGAKITIPIPYNTSYIIINGTGGPAQAEYFVEFDPPASLTPVHMNQTTGVATSPWVAPAVLAVTPLDPSIQYQLAFSAQGQADIAIHSVTYYGGVLDNFPTWAPIREPTPPNQPNSADSAAATPPKKKKNAGAIAGGVIGGLIALAIIAGLVWYFLRRRRRRVDRADMAEFVIDDTADPGHPYLAPMTQKSKWNHISTRETQPVVKPGMSSPHLIASEASSDGYTAEQLGASFPSTTDSQGYLLSPLAPVGPTKWTTSDSPVSPNAPLSPLAGRMESVTPFNNMMGFSAAGSNYPISPRRQLRRAPRVNQLIHQESDGGSIQRDHDETTDSEDVDEVLVVPPSYDPAWIKPKQKKRSSWRNEHALRLKVP